MGWKDPSRQREKAMISARVRQERRRPRNQRMVELHRSGWSIERIARREELSWIQTWRIIAKDRMEPGIYHQPIAPPGNDEREGKELRGNDEIRNGRVQLLANETSLYQPNSDRKQPIISIETDEISQNTPLVATSSVDNSDESVENSSDAIDDLRLSWDEAFRQAGLRRAEQYDRAVQRERERQAWRDRGPPEE